MTVNQELQNATEYLKGYLGNKMRCGFVEDKILQPLSPRDIGAVGFDSAKRLGFLSIYKSAVGFKGEPDFKTFWEPKLSHLCVDPR